MSFVVACGADHAFSTWTARASVWWPPEHTASGESGLQIVFEPRAGGRIFERTRGGIEIEWGEITEWDPPHRLRYRWTIATDPSNATDVDIVFRELSDASTRIDIEHGGWDRLGPIGESWRATNQGGWDGVMPSYVAACGERPTQARRPR
jgi:uncharacterized protein YndB with AHSA1/START domain